MDSEKMSLWYTLVYVYLLTVMLAAPYYNWQFAREYGFVRWLAFGELVPSAKALVWPYFAFSSSPAPADQEAQVGSAAASSNQDFSADEFAVISRVMNKKDPLDSSDLDGLRKAMKRYASRTGSPLTRQDVDVLSSQGQQANEYYYELAKSMLISWDSGRYETTVKFDDLFAQMKGSRKPGKLSYDLGRIRSAARHASFETNEAGSRYALSRAEIVRQMGFLAVATENLNKVVSVMNESAR